jgi:hypothetical protein
METPLYLHNSLPRATVTILVNNQFVVRYWHLFLSLKEFSWNHQILIFAYIFKYPYCSPQGVRVVRCLNTVISSSNLTCSKAVCLSTIFLSCRQKVKPKWLIVNDLRSHTMNLISILEAWKNYTTTNDLSNHEFKFYSPLFLCMTDKA